MTDRSENKGEISDGYHTFNQLYHQRAILFATIVNQNKDKAWKSFKHSDGHYCFDEDGEMFIVGIDTPKGSYTYHYHKKYWDYFDCKELECGKVWDGHTEEDVTRLLSLEQQPCEDCISRQAVIDKAFDFMDDDCDTYRAVYVSDIRKMPPVTPKRLKGKWIATGVNGQFECSCCQNLWQDAEENTYDDWIHIAKFCPCCGAEMKGEEDANNN